MGRYVVVGDGLRCDLNIGEANLMKYQIGLGCCDLGRIDDRGTGAAGERVVESTGPIAVCRCRRAHTLMESAGIGGPTIVLDYGLGGLTDSIGDEDQEQRLRAARVGVMNQRSRRSHR